jgi:hypothetical protein
MQIWKAVCGALRLSRGVAIPRLFHPVPRQGVASDGRSVNDSSLSVPATPHCAQYNFYLPSGFVHYHYDARGGFYAYEGSECPSAPAEAQAPGGQGEGLPGSSRLG